MTDRQDEADDWEPPDSDWDPNQYDWDPEHDEIDIDTSLAGLPEDVRAAFEAESWTGEGEAFAAGFLHHDDGPCGTGFASGGPLDTLKAGPLLAEMIDMFTANGHELLGESELIGVLCAWRRISSWAAAGEAAAVLTLNRRRHAQARERENRNLAEHVTEELAAALTLTSRSADLLMDDAIGLGRLAEVHQQLSAGQIDWPKACVFVRELVVVGDHDAAQIAAKVLPDAHLMTTSQIRAALRRLVLEVDPDAAIQRKKDGAKDAEVCVWTEASGNAALAGRELPESEALSADRRLTALARWLIDRGVEGSIGQLRAAVFSALLNGKTVQSLLPEGVPQTPGPDNPAGSVPAVSGTVNLTMPLSALAGLTDKHGEVTGYGPTDADTCRDLARMLAASPATRWCITGTDASGRAAAHVCAGRGKAPPAGSAVLDWAARESVHRAVWLENGSDCEHRLAEGRYLPSSLLRHLIQVRQPECSFPGCRRPAVRCDLDHTIPYEDGGLTCSCNLAPLCRRHHQAKQVPGWRLDQPQPGVMVWRAPHGRSYQAKQHQYSV